MDTSTTADHATQRKVLTTEQLRQRAHNHAIVTFAQARMYQTGELDIDLLEAAGLHVEKAAREHPRLSIRIWDMVHNKVMGREEAIYLAYAPNQQFVGNYFASAFKSLAT